MTDLPSLEDLAAFAERMDADVCVEFAHAAPHSVRVACGVQAKAYGNTIALQAAKVDVLALNRVVNLGMGEPASPALIEALVAGYRAAGAPRFFVQLCPFARPELVVAWLRARGFYPYNNWVRLYRGVEPPPEPRTALRIEQIGPERAEAFGDLVAEAFGWPAVTRPWVGAFIGRPRWRHYMAFDGSTPVATGALYVQGDLGWVGFAATARASRGRGAQSALIARRIRDAAMLGCRWLVAEVAEDRPDRPNPSYHNMVRSGFQVAYLRQNYLWTPDGRT